MRPSSYVGTCRLANHLAKDVGKLGFRGTICNDEAKWEHAKVGHAPAIWFVFSGAALFSSLCIVQPRKISPSPHLTYPTIEPTQMRFWERLLYLMSPRLQPQ